MKKSTNPLTTVSLFLAIALISTAAHATRWCAVRVGEFGKPDESKRTMEDKFPSYPKEVQEDPNNRLIAETEKLVFGSDDRHAKGVKIKRNGKEVQVSAWQASSDKIYILKIGDTVYHYDLQNSGAFPEGAFSFTGTKEDVVIHARGSVSFDFYVDFLKKKGANTVVREGHTAILEFTDRETDKKTYVPVRFE